MALARRSGVTQSAISSYERGRKVPTLATLGRLAEAVGKELDVAIDASTATTPPTIADVRRSRPAIMALYLRHGASNPRVFGSVARNTAESGSDIDLLVDMEPGRTFFDVAALHDDLEELLGRPVDVLTSGALRGRLAPVVDQAVPL